MQALKDLFKSERGLFALALVTAATVLCALDKMPIAAWQEMALYVFGIYAAGKTISGTASLLAGAAQVKADSSLTLVEAINTLVGQQMKAPVGEAAPVAAPVVEEAKVPADAAKSTDADAAKSDDASADKPAA